MKYNNRQNKMKKKNFQFLKANHKALLLGMIKHKKQMISILKESMKIITMKYLKVSLILRNLR